MVSSTAAVAWWIERLPREREVVGSIPGQDRPKSLKLVEVALSSPPPPMALTVIGRPLRLVLQGQDNGLVKIMDWFSTG